MRLRHILYVFVKKRKKSLTGDSGCDNIVLAAEKDGKTKGKARTVFKKKIKKFLTNKW